MATPRGRGRGKKKNMAVAANRTAAVPLGGDTALLLFAESVNLSRQIQNRPPSSQYRHQQQQQQHAMTMRNHNPKPLPENDNYNKHRRRNTKKLLRHEIALWWTPSSTAENEGGAKYDESSSSCPVADFFRDGARVTDLTSLSEGENWIAVVFMDECNPPTTAINQASSKLLHLSTINSCRRLYLDRDHNIMGGRSKKSLDGIHGKSLVEAANDGHEGKSNLRNIPVLCIDVDNVGNCVTVKDIRRPTANDDDQNIDAESKTADDELDFFLVRRTSLDHQQRNKHKDKSEGDPFSGDNDARSAIGTGPESSGVAGGYNTDDEKDSNDEIQEMNDRNNELRFCDDLGSGSKFDVGGDKYRRHGHPALPREADVDQEGNLLYDWPEPLPRRQLRVLRDGDRILMRYWPQTASSKVRCVKLEYLYGKYHSQRQAHQPESINVHSADADADPGETQEKLRLFSMKSTDGLSYDKKGSTLNSTSAAKAPSVNDDNMMETFPGTNANSDRHNEREDWSDVERPSKGEGAKSSSRQERSGRVNNAEQDGGQSSYLTGEVIVKDQEYVSVITGDDATTPSAMALGKAEHGGNKQDNDEGENALTSDVAIGAATSPSKNTDTTSRDEKDPPPPVTLHKDAHEAAGQKSNSVRFESNQNGNENKVEFIEEPCAAANEDQEIFLTAQEQDINDDDDDKMQEENSESYSEEELLSQPDHGDSPAKFETVDTSSEEDDESDVSKTQPFIIPKSVTNNTWLHSLLAVEKERDDEDSTECSEEGCHQKIAADSNGDGKACSSLPEGVGVVRQISKKVGIKGDDYDDDWDEQPTQPWVPANLNAKNQIGKLSGATHDDDSTKFSEEDDDEKIAADSNGDGKSCFSPAEIVVPKTAKKEGIYNHDSDCNWDEQPTQPWDVNQNIAPDNHGIGKLCQATEHDFSDEEPTQKFPLTKPINVVNRNIQHYEDDEAYQAETQDEICPKNQEDVYQKETQTLLPFPFNLPATLAHLETGVVSANNANQDKTSSQPKSLDEKDTSGRNKTTVNQTDSLKGAAKNIGTFDTVTAKSEMLNGDIEDGSNSKSNEVPTMLTTAKSALENVGYKEGNKHELAPTKPLPFTAKESQEVSECQVVVEEVQLPPEKFSGVLEDEKRNEQKRDPTEPPLANMSLKQASEPDASTRDLPPLPYETCDTLKNVGLKKGAQHKPESTSKEPPKQASQREAAVKEIQLLLENASKKGEKQELESSKAPSSNEKASGILENGLKERKEEEETSNPPTNEPSHEVLESRVVGENPMPPEITNGARENEGIKKVGEQQMNTTKLPPAKELPKRDSQRCGAALRTAYDDSAVRKQRLENNAVTRVHSGAIMTGPVGGAVALLNHPKEPADQEPSLLSAIANTFPSPHPSPDAAAVPEETAVCLDDKTDLKQDQGSAVAVGDLVERTHNEKVAYSSLKKQEHLGDRNACADSRDRDPSIPSTISCINTRVGHGRHSSKGLTTPRNRPKRKRGVSSSGRRRETNETVRIMFTGINPTRRHKQMIDDIGAQLVDSIEDALTATHIIASDGKTKLRRTPKLMICVCKTSKILSIEWLEQSAKQQRVLDTDDFLLLGDREAEKRYNFSMKKTLENGKRARLESNGVLGGWSLYIANGVAGNEAPSSKELHLVVEATGATQLGVLKMATDPLKTIVITSDPSTQSQLKEVANALQGAKILSTSWLFHTIITQNFSTMNGEESSPHPKQRSKRKATRSPPNQVIRRKSSRQR